LKQFIQSIPSHEQPSSTVSGTDSPNKTEVSINAGHNDRILKRLAALESAYEAQTVYVRIPQTNLHLIVLLIFHRLLERNNYALQKRITTFSSASFYMLFFGFVIILEPKLLV
jgi:hypothetical protein